MLAVVTITCQDHGVLSNVIKIDFWEGQLFFHAVCSFRTSIKDFCWNTVKLGHVEETETNLLPGIRPCVRHESYLAPIATPSRAEAGDWFLALVISGLTWDKSQFFHVFEQRRRFSRFLTFDTASPTPCSKRFYPLWHSHNRWNDSDFSFKARRYFFKIFFFKRFVLPSLLLHWLVKHFADFFVITNFLCRLQIYLANVLQLILSKTWTFETLDWCFFFTITP